MNLSSNTPSPPSRRSGRWPTTSAPIPNVLFPRVILIVLDSVGCGELPDAAAYGDEGSDTLGHIAARIGLRVPYLRSLGLDRVANIGPAPEGWADRPTAGVAYGRMAERSPGKDSVTG